MDALKLKASFEKFTLDFKRPSGTSRGVLTQKTGWLLKIEDESGREGFGECSVIAGLTPEYESDESYEQKIIEVCNNILRYIKNIDLLNDFSSIKFAVESAWLDFQNGGKRIYFTSGHTTFQLPINGLIWMGEPSFMQTQIQEKIDAGFTCIKLKIGALNFYDELQLLENFRSYNSAKKITLRVDANGAFNVDEALEKLHQLARFEIHSIEQPIKAGQWNEMKALCSSSLIPIALDEELIGIHGENRKVELLETINPKYIILKPSLHGGVSGTREWIELAEERKIGWWITSALESNIGLTIIAQFTATFSPTLPQGLGTGGLFTTNFDAPLLVENGFLKYLK